MIVSKAAQCLHVFMVACALALLVAALVLGGGSDLRVHIFGAGGLSALICDSAANSSAQPNDNSNTDSSSTLNADSTDKPKTTDKPTANSSDKPTASPNDEPTASSTDTPNADKNPLIDPPNCSHILTNLMFSPAWKKAGMVLLVIIVVLTVLALFWTLFATCCCYNQRALRWKTSTALDTLVALLTLAVIVVAYLCHSPTDVVDRGVGWNLHWNFYMICGAFGASICASIIATIFAAIS